MDVKVIKPQHAVSSEPSRNTQDSRGLRILQYFTKTVSGSNFKEPDNAQSLQNGSESEDSEEEASLQPDRSSLISSTSSLGAARPSLLRKLSYRLVKSESPYTDEENSQSQNADAHAWGAKKSVFEVSRSVAADIRGSFGRAAQIKHVLIEKLASIPSIPSDSLEHARHSIESIFADATQSAYGKTKDAMLRIRLKIVEIIPSLSPHETKKIVDDAEREANDVSKANGSDCEEGNPKGRKEDRAAASIVAPQPTSALTARMDRLKGLLQSRL